MNTLSQDLINEIRNSVDIVDVVSSYISLIQKGKNYFGICPFHDDNNPSMSVSKEKQIYKCFSCGATGNVFKFLMDYENISFIESVKKCADISGIKLDIKINNNTRNSNQFATLYEIYDIAQKFYHNNINTKESDEARKYLLSRNISDEMIKIFGIGLSLKSRNLLTKLLVNKKYLKDDLIKSGLVIENGSDLSDIYYDRIMFPLEDLTGRVVGFSGRLYNGEKNYKYINTKETDIFKKGDILYNYSRAKDSARQKGFVIVMEGFMDVIRAYSIGITNVVATMGTSVTANQLRVIKKMAKDIYLCFDGDDAGQKATNVCADELLKTGINPKILYLENNLDPDEYIQKYGKDKFINKINNPITFMDFKFMYLKKGKDIGNSVDLATYINSVIKEVEKIDDEVLKEVTLKKISLESNLDIKFLKDQLNNTKKDKQNNQEQIKIKHKKTKYDIAQENLVYYMLHFKDVIKIYNKKVTYMSNQQLRVLAREISLYYKANNGFSLADFMTYLQDRKDLYDTLSKVLTLELNDNYKEQEIEDYINVIQTYNTNLRINKLKEKMGQVVDPMEQAKLAEEIKKIKMDIKERDEYYE